MKKTILILSLISIFVLPIFAQNESFSIKIHIINLKNNKGKVLLQLLNEDNEIISKNQEKIIGKTCTFNFENIPKGKYYIQYFHDENNNDKLDNNFFGLPAEGYGFSNNAKSSFGPPSIEKKIFLINKNSSITLKINY